MITLSLDIAKNTGYSIWQDNDLLSSGSLSLKHIQKKDYNSMNDYYIALRKEFWKLLATIPAINYNVVIETPVGSKSSQAANMFQLLHSVATIFYMARDVYYVGARKWKNHFEIAGTTKEQKEQAMDLCKKVHIYPKTHDEADSILMYSYWYMNKDKGTK